MLHAYFNPFNLKDQILSRYKLHLRSHAGQSSHHPWEEVLIRSRLRQPAGSQPWHFSIGATIPPPVENASWGTGQASWVELEWSCLARGSQGSRAGDYSDLLCLGLVWLSVTFRCQAEEDSEPSPWLPIPTFCVSAVLTYLVAMKHELQGPDPQKPCTLHRYLCQRNTSAEKI